MMENGDFSVSPSPPPSVSSELNKEEMEELEQYLYSQVYYKNDDYEKAHKQLNCSDVISISSDDGCNETKNVDHPKNDVAPSNCKYVVQSSDDNDDYDNSDSNDNNDNNDMVDSKPKGKLSLLFNKGTSDAIFPAQNHPLMSKRIHIPAASTRYFATVTPEDRISEMVSKMMEENGEFFCYLCGSSAHLAKSCHSKIQSRPNRNFKYAKTTGEFCSTCGKKDHHLRQWMIRGPPRFVCPNVRCGGCGQPGHKLTECEQYPLIRGRVCRKCGISGHIERSCPDLWRMYHNSLDKNPLSIPQQVSINSNRYCFICGKKGHFGFECFWSDRPATARFVCSPFVTSLTTTEKPVTVELENVENNQCHAPVNYNHERCNDSTEFSQCANRTPSYHRYPNAQKTVPIHNNWDQKHFNNKPYLGNLSFKKQKPGKYFCFTTPTHKYNWTI